MVKFNKLQETEKKFIREISYSPLRVFSFHNKMFNIIKKEIELINYFCSYTTIKLQRTNESSHKLSEAKALRLKPYETGVNLSIFIF